MTVYKKRKKKERMHFFINEDMKRHLYEASEHTGTAASEIIRQALRKELENNYRQHKEQ